MSDNNKKDKAGARKSLSEIFSGNSITISDTEQLAIVGGKKSINKDRFNDGISTIVPC
jgi:hypothetical protein